MSDTLRKRLNNAARMGELIQNHWDEIAALLDIAEAAQDYAKKRLPIGIAASTLEGQNLYNALAALDSGETQE